MGGANGVICGANGVICGANGVVCGANDVICGANDVICTTNGDSTIDGGICTTDGDRNNHNDRSSRASQEDSRHESRSQEEDIQEEEGQLLLSRAFSDCLWWQSTSKDVICFVPGQTSGPKMGSWSTGERNALNYFLLYIVTLQF